LWPLIEEDDSGAVDDVGLHLRAIQQSLHVLEADDIVVHIAPDLQQTMSMVMPSSSSAAAHAAMLAYSPIAVDAEDVPLVLLQCGVLCAWDEEFLAQKRL